MPATSTQPGISESANYRADTLHHTYCDSPTSIEEIKRLSIRGAAIAAASQCTTISLHVISVAVLSRVLVPEDFGMVAMVTVFTAFAGVFRDFGLTAASVQRATLSKAQMSTLFWMNVAVGALLTILVAASSPLVASFYNIPALQPLTVLLSTSFFISSFGAQHAALLMRSMAFVRLGIASALGALVTLLVTVTLATNEFGFWALAYGTLSGSAVTTLITILASPFRPGLPVRKCGVRDMFNFGAHTTAFEVINHVHRNIDNLLIGCVWGPTALGIYTRAYTVMMFPIQSIRTPIHSVAFPALSRLSNDPPALQRYYLRATTLVALISMPTAAFLFSAASPMVDLLFGSHWSDVKPVLRGLALAGFIQPVAGFSGTLLQGMGMARRRMECGLINTVILSLAMLGGLSWGAEGVAIAYGVGNYVALAPYLWWAFRPTPVTLTKFAASCSSSFIASILAAATTAGLSPLMSGIAPWYEVTVLALVFTFAYGCALLVSSVGRTRLLPIAQDCAQRG